jgi:hypothetical protein
MIRLSARASRAYASTLALTVAASFAAAAFAEPSVFPTGTTRYDPAKAWNGYVVFSAPDQKTHLIDMDGHEVRRWDYQGFPGQVLDPAVTGGAKGHVLVQLAAGADGGTGEVPGAAIFDNKTIGELDWDGKVVWSWGETAPGGAARQHHDLRREANGNTVVLANLPHAVSGFSAPKVLDDVVYVVDPAGKVVWRWVASEHLDEFGFTPEQLALVKASKSPDYLHINNLSLVGPNKWFDAGDARFAPDNILIDSRNANVIVIIDRKTSKVVWRLGPNFPARASRREPGKLGERPPLPRPVDQLSGQHDAHIIPPGLPGAGNLLVFDNQGEAGYPPVALGIDTGSRVLEIDPVKQEIVWSYSANDSGAAGWTFYSSFISSARRLPNGNTLIDEGINGRFFQVTPAGEIVWEYVSPYFARTAVGGVGLLVNSNWVYRATPVPYDWTPAGTPHSETPVVAPEAGGFRVGGQR